MSGTQCERCGIWGGGAHECLPFPGLPANYEELERMTDEEREIEREAARLGVHPFVLIRQRHQAKKDAETVAAAARLVEWCEKQGMTP